MNEDYDKKYKYNSQTLSDVDVLNFIYSFPNVLVYFFII